MKAITIKQPWASMIVEGIKDVENRTWRTSFRGRVLIHAGAKEDIRWYDRTNELSASIVHNTIERIFSEKDYNETFGTIIGSVEIIDCVINYQSIWAEKTNSLSKSCYNELIHTPNKWIRDINENLVFKPDVVYNWVLANPVKFDKPIPAKGKLSFWEFDM